MRRKSLKATESRSRYRVGRRRARAQVALLRAAGAAWFLGPCRREETGNCGSARTTRRSCPSLDDAKVVPELRANSQRGQGRAGRRSADRLVKIETPSIMAQ